MGIVIKNHNIVSIGTSSIFKGGKSKCHTRHAEQHAMSKVKNLKGCILVSIRFKENWMNSRPCTHCSKEMIKNRIKKVVFFENNKWKIETPLQCYENGRPSSLQRAFAIPNCPYIKKRHCEIKEKKIKK